MQRGLCLPDQNGDCSSGDDSGNSGGGTNTVEICYDVVVLAEVPCTGGGHYIGDACQCQITDFSCIRAKYEFQTQQECYTETIGSSGSGTNNTGNGGSNNNDSGFDNNTITTPISDIVPDGADPKEWFEEQVFIDQNFKDIPCIKSVYDDMGKASKFQEYLRNFDNEMSVANLRFTTDDDFGNNNQDYTNAMAITNPPLSSNEIVITFNTDPNTSGNILTKPDVFKAVAMIHEIIHAEMYRKMLDAVRAAGISGNNLNWANWTSEQFYNDFLDSLQNKYFGIFDYFTRYNYGTPVGNEPNDWQHEQIAQHYRDVIKQALTDYDSTLTNAQKEALSWIGLNEANIKAWQNLTQPERDNINQTITQIKNTFPNGC